MDFSYSDKVKDLQRRLTAYMQDYIIPAESVAAEFHAANRDHWGAPPMMTELKAEAKRQGLWNLFLPEDDRGAGQAKLFVQLVGDLDDAHEVHCVGLIYKSYTFRMLCVNPTGQITRLIVATCC